MKQKIDAIRQELKKQVDGKIMIRQNRTYRGLEQEGILTYDVYYEYPTPSNKTIIKEVLERKGVHRVHNSIVVGGVYGYVIAFQVKNGE